MFYSVYKIVEIYCNCDARVQVTEKARGRFAAINIRLSYACQTATIARHTIKSTYIYRKQCLKATGQVHHHKGEEITLYRVYSDVMIWSVSRPL